MCGVVGFVGSKLSRQKVLDGLARLEYRGYDSAGFACIMPRNKKLDLTKAVGPLESLRAQLAEKTADGFLGIGHTRWATHGATTFENAHPHTDCENTIAVVHNGIIENHQTLKNYLKESAHHFRSEADSEVIAHAAEEAMRGQTDPLKVLLHVSKLLEGSYAYAFLSERFYDTLFVARNRSPLCVGKSATGIAVASDPLAFDDEVEEIIFLPDKSCALLTEHTVQVFDFDGNQLSVACEPAFNHVASASKGEYEHFMLKEIYEQKQAVFRTINSYRSGGSLEETFGLSTKKIKDLENLTLVGCGTSWHASLIGAFFFESVARVHTVVARASELRYREFLPYRNNLCIAVSQSGETADTLEAVDLIKQNGVPVVTLTNVPFSSLVRESNGFFLTEAGPEVAVASTKAFSTQVASLYWIAHQIAYVKGLIGKKELDCAEQELGLAAESLESNIVLCKDAVLTDIDLYRSFKNYIFLGRHIGYPLALEAALKLNEISYIFSQAYPAGELKHGPLALVDEAMPVIIFSHPDPLIYQKLVSNAQEIKARGGFLVTFACQGQKELLALADRGFELRSASSLLMPLAMTGIMQYFCYALAKAEGRSIDKPRNLAKSVTVE